MPRFVARSWHETATGRSTVASPARRFGSIRRLPSGRYQARYVGPDRQTHKAPVTFSSKGDAETYLATARADIVRSTWQPPSRRPDRAPTLHEYADDWLMSRSRELKPRTTVLYRGLLDRHLYPTLGAMQLDQISPAAVRAWHSKLDTGPTRRAHAYSLLRTILNTAVADDVIPANPCRLRGAGQSRRVKDIRPATLKELDELAEAMPHRLRLIVLLAAWCGLRFGELVELRRKDVDTKEGLLRVRRAVTWVDGKPVVGVPKSDAGVRVVAIPPHLLPAVAEHLLQYAGKGQDGLLFTAVDGASLLTHDMLKRPFDRARQAAGRPDLRFHDLRHTGAVLAAQTGATLAELMARLGHSTPGAALRYQHAAAGRDAQIAVALSRIANDAGQP
jgi:integrase